MKRKSFIYLLLTLILLFSVSAQTYGRWWGRVYINGEIQEDTAKVDAYLGNSLADSTTVGKYVSRWYLIQIFAKDGDLVTFYVDGQNASTVQFSEGDHEQLDLHVTEPKALGEACSADEYCESGVCCDSVCAESCEPPVVEEVVEEPVTEPVVEENVTANATQEVPAETNETAEIVVEVESNETSVQEPVVESNETMVEEPVVEETNETAPVEVPVNGSEVMVNETEVQAAEEMNETEAVETNETSALVTTTLNVTLEENASISNVTMEENESISNVTDNTTISVDIPIEPSGENITEPEAENKSAETEVVLVNINDNNTVAQDQAQEETKNDTAADIQIIYEDLGEDKGGFKLSSWYITIGLIVVILVVLFLLTRRKKTELEFEVY